MLRTKPVFIVFLMLLFFITACKGDDGIDRKPVFQEVTELKEIKPERPVRIKLKRGTSGKYSWEISGDDADRIIKADSTLKESIGKDE